MKTHSILARAVLVPTAASLFVLTGCCGGSVESSGPHQTASASAQVDPKDAKIKSSGPHQHARRPRPHPAGSSGPHQTNGAPSPSPTPGQ